MLLTSASRPGTRRCPPLRPHPTARIPLCPRGVSVSWQRRCLRRIPRLSAAARGSPPPPPPDPASLPGHRRDKVTARPALTVHPLPGAALQQNRQQPQQPDRYIHLHVSIHISSPAVGGPRGGGRGSAKPSGAPRSAAAEPRTPAQAGRRGAGGGHRSALPPPPPPSPPPSLPPPPPPCAAGGAERRGAERRGPSPAHSPLRAPAAAAAASRGRRAPPGAAAASRAPRPSDAIAAPRPPHDARGPPRGAEEGASGGGRGAAEVGPRSWGPAGRAAGSPRRSARLRSGGRAHGGGGGGPSAARWLREREARPAVCRHVVLYVPAAGAGEPQPGDVKAAWLAAARLPPPPPPPPPSPPPPPGSPRLRHRRRVRREAGGAEPERRAAPGDGMRGAVRSAPGCAERSGAERCPRGPRCAPGLRGADGAGRTALALTALSAPGRGAARPRLPSTPHRLRAELRAVLPRGRAGSALLKGLSCPRLPARACWEVAGPICAPSGLVPTVIALKPWAP